MNRLEEIKQITEKGKIEAAEAARKATEAQVEKEKLAKIEKKAAFERSVKWHTKRAFEKIRKAAGRGKNKCIYLAEFNKSNYGLKLFGRVAENLGEFHPVIKKKVFQREEEDGIDHSIHYVYPTYTVVEMKMSFSW